MKTKKPRPFRKGVAQAHGVFRCRDYSTFPPAVYVDMESEENPAELRKLAAWLLKAADWLEGQRVKK